MSIETPGHQPDSRDWQTYCRDGDANGFVRAAPTQDVRAFVESLELPVWGRTIPPVSAGLAAYAHAFAIQAIEQWIKR